MTFWDEFWGRTPQCQHSWELVDKLYDDDKAPNAITIVRHCTGCGSLKTDTVKGPDKPKPPHRCSDAGHRWNTTKTVQKIGQMIPVPGTTRKDYSTEGYTYYQQCRECGDLRVVALEDKAGDTSNVE